VLAVGAVEPPLGTAIAGYSSWGPTNDGRIKPDLSAASGFTSTTYLDVFNGTSAATPVVAAAAALLLEAYPGTTPPGTANWLLDFGVQDRGAAGPDNVFGRGELVLPAPFSRPDMTSVTAKQIKDKAKRTAKVKVTWAGTDPDGIAAYEVYRQVGSKPWAKQPLSRPLQTSLVQTLPAETRVRYAVRARDRQSLWSLDRYSARLTLSR
jgi:subtilisin family serine protease